MSLVRPGVVASISTEDSQVVHGAGLRGGVTWRVSASGDCDCKLGMVSGLRRSSPSSEALISSSVGTSTYTEGPRVLHAREPVGLPAGLAGTVALPEAAPIDVLAA